ncbi:hypothetical protein [Nostoc sp.]
MALEGVILDIDGTLVLSNVAIAIDNDPEDLLQHYDFSILGANA